MDTKEEDFVTRIISTHTHAKMCIFTDRGLAYGVKVWELQRGAANSRGRPIVNYVQLGKGDRIMRAIVLPDPEEREGKSLLFVTSTGQVRRNAIDDFASMPSNGKIAMKLDEADDVHVVDVLVCSDSDEIVLMSTEGMTTRFKASDVRVFNSRYSMGVAGMRLREGDTIISAAVVPSTDIPDIEEENLFSKDDPEKARAIENSPALLTVTASGYGKRTPVSAYRHSRRGARGVLDRPDPKRCGPIVGSLVINADSHVMIMTKDGTTLRMKAGEIRGCGRNSLGVRLLKLKQGNTVVAVTEVPEESMIEDEAGSA
jgi:DNA gyrase subunit A